MGGGVQKGRASCCSALCSSIITLTNDSMARPRSSAMWNKLPILGPAETEREQMIQNTRAANANVSMVRDSAKTQFFMTEH